MKNRKRNRKMKRGMAILLAALFLSETAFGDIYGASCGLSHVYAAEETTAESQAAAGTEQPGQDAVQSSAAETKTVQQTTPAETQTASGTSEANTAAAVTTTAAAQTTS